MNPNAMNPSQGMPFNNNMIKQEDSNSKVEHIKQWIPEAKPPSYSGVPIQVISEITPRFLYDFSHIKDWSHQPLVNRELLNKTECRVAPLPPFQSMRAKPEASDIPKKMQSVNSELRYHLKYLQLNFQYLQNQTNPPPNQQRLQQLDNQIKQLSNPKRMINKLCSDLVQFVCQEQKLNCPRPEEIVKVLCTFVDQVLYTLLSKSAQNARHRSNYYVPPNQKVIYTSIPSYTNQFLLFENMIYSDISKKIFDQNPQPPPFSPDLGITNMGDFQIDPDNENFYEPIFCQIESSKIAALQNIDLEENDRMMKSMNVVKRKEETRNVPLSKEITDTIKGKMQELMKKQVKTQSPQMQPQIPPGMQPQMPGMPNPMPPHMQMGIPNQFMQQPGMNPYQQMPPSNRIPMKSPGLSKSMLKTIEKSRQKKDDENRRINYDDLLLFFSTPGNNFMKGSLFVQQQIKYKMVQVRIPKPQSQLMQQQPH